MSDIIDRQALIGVFAGLVPYAIDSFEDSAYARGLDAGYQAVVEAPAVDAEPVKRGRWISEPDRHNHWHCSECGFTEGIVARFYRFCPNCGAKMEVGE